MRSAVTGSFLHGAVVRWILYAVTFGLLWGVVADALIFGDGAKASVIRGILGGIFFATVAVLRETRGTRRRLR